MVQVFAWLSRAVKYVFAGVVKATAPVAVPAVEQIKRLTGCRTYHVEYGFVVIALITVNAATGHLADPWKWVESAAVFLTFSHASISQRMEERQRFELESQGVATVECFEKLEPIFIGKEALWFIAFFHAGLYPALVGVCIFLMYYPWRDEWRKRHPIAA